MRDHDLEMREALPSVLNGSGFLRLAISQLRYLGLQLFRPVWRASGTYSLSAAKQAAPEPGGCPQAYRSDYRTIGTSRRQAGASAPYGKADCPPLRDPSAMRGPVPGDLRGWRLKSADSITVRAARAETALISPLAFPISHPQVSSQSFITKALKTK
uniref:Uncharacterized protein n=1 Tax=Sphaerodactylus townsendi TaxID=933632 RepID=A0ACB8E885_9SAUR